MPLEHCNECGSMISTTARVCPKCGHRPRRNSFVLGVAVYVGLIAIGVLLLSFWEIAGGTIILVATVFLAAHVLRRILV